jgi:ribosomal protein S15P/S13E
MASVGLQLASETTAGITYTIFRTSVEQMGYVTNLFHYLESKNALVDDFMVSHTTLEDVFLRLTHGEGMVVDAAPTWDNEQTISDLQRLVREHETTIATLTQQVKDLQEHLSQYTVDDIN